MGSPLVDVGTGIVIDFGTSGFVAEVLDVNGPSLARDSVETTHQGTTGARTHMPVDLYDAGELGFDIHFNPDTDPPIDKATEEITITWPSGAIWVFDAFVTAEDVAAPLEDKMVASITLKITGDIAITPAA